MKLILSLKDIVSNMTRTLEFINLPKTALCADRQILQHKPVALTLFGIFELKGVDGEISDEVPCEHAIGRR